MCGQYSASTLADMFLANARMIPRNAMAWVAATMTA